MPDKTYEAVKKQVQAMGAARFEIGVFDASTERMIPRVWDKDTVLKSVPWLRYENLKGRNIYIRPAGEHNLSLVDDLKASAILTMKTGGFSVRMRARLSNRVRMIQRSGSHGNIPAPTSGTDVNDLTTTSARCG